MSIKINSEEFKTLSDYLNDENKVTQEEKIQIEIKAKAIIEKTKKSHNNSAINSVGNEK